MNSLYLLYLVGLPLAMCAPLVLLCALVALTADRLRSQSASVLWKAGIAASVAAGAVSLSIFVLSGFRRLPIDVALIAGGAAFTVVAVVHAVWLSRARRHRQNAV